MSGLPIPSGKWRISVGKRKTFNRKVQTSDGKTRTSDGIRTPLFQFDWGLAN